MSLATLLEPTNQCSAAQTPFVSRHLLRRLVSTTRTRPWKDAVCSSRRCVSCTRTSSRLLVFSSSRSSRSSLLSRLLSISLALPSQTAFPVRISDGQQEHCVACTASWRLFRVAHSRNTSWAPLLVWHAHTKRRRTRCPLRRPSYLAQPPHPDFAAFADDMWTCPILLCRSTLLFQTITLSRTHTPHTTLFRRMHKRRQNVHVCYKMCLPSPRRALSMQMAGGLCRR